MPLLSEIARRRKVDYFLPRIPKEARILEVGSGDGWLGSYLRSNGWPHYTGMNLTPPADIVGDVRDWKAFGIEAESFDAIIAFELVEHVDCLRQMYDLLRPGGLLMLTSPHPQMDWICKLLEFFGLTQRRTSPHDHLVDFRRVSLFEPVAIRRYGLASQWGVFRKPLGSE